MHPVLICCSQTFKLATVSEDFLAILFCDAVVHLLGETHNYKNHEPVKMFQNKQTKVRTC